MTGRYSIHPMEQNYHDWTKKRNREEAEFNAWIAARWDELSKAGQHGHYETLFKLVREAIHFHRRQCEQEKI